jgi:hypothetical protein
VKRAWTKGGVGSSCWGADKPLPVVNTVQFRMFRGVWNRGKVEELNPQERFRELLFGMEE